MSSLSKIQHQPSPIQEFIIPIIEHRWFKYPFREFGMFILDGYNEMVLPILPKKDMPASRMPKYMKFGKSLMENPREFKYNALPPFQLQTRFGIVNVYPYLKIIEKPISSPNYLSTKDIHFVSLDEIYAKKYCSMNIHNSVLDMFNQQSPLYKLAFIQKSKSSYFPIPKIGFHGTDQYGDKEKDPKNDIVKKIIETGFKQSRKDSENPPMFGEGIYLGNFWKAARYSFFKNDINYTFRNHPVLIRTVFDMGPRPYFIPPNWTSEKYQYSLSYNYLSLDRERKLNGNPPLGSDKIYQNYEEADNDFHDPEGNLLKQGYSSVIVHPFSLKIRDRRARNNYKLKSFVSHPEYIIPSNDNIGILSMYHLDPNSTAKHTKYTFKNGRNQIRISESPEVHEDEQMINKPGDPRYWKYHFTIRIL